MQFKRIPDVVDAVQWWPSTDPRHVEIPNVINEEPEVTSPYGLWPPRAWLRFKDGGITPVHVGDWVVTELNGRVHLVVDSAFQLTYQAI